MSRKCKEPKPYHHTGIIILNPYGDVWGPNIYDTEEQAIQSIKQFWNNNPKLIAQFKYRLVRGKAIVSALPTPEFTRVMTETEDECGANAIYTVINDAAQGMRSQHVLTGIAMFLAGYLYKNESVSVDMLMKDMQQAVDRFLGQLRDDAP